MKRKIINNQNGMTLLEVMVALMILTMSLLLLLNMSMIAMDANHWANNTTISTQLIQEKLEQLRASQVPTGGSDTTMGVIRTWDVTGPVNNLYEVDIAVAWLDIKGEAKADTLQAYLKTD